MNSKSKTKRSEEKSCLEKSNENQNDDSELDSGEEEFIDPQLEQEENNSRKKSKYDCVFCGETFSNDNVLSGHLKLAHSKFANKNDEPKKKNADADAITEDDNISDEEKLNDIENEENEMDMDNDSMAKETLVIPENTTKWNLCTYQCCFCKRITMSRSSMTNHIQISHDLSVPVSILSL